MNQEIVKAESVKAHQDNKKENMEQKCYIELTMLFNQLKKNDKIKINSLIKSLLSAP